MQEQTEYLDVVTDVKAFLAHRIAACREAGIAKDQMMIDPKVLALAKRLRKTMKCYEDSRNLPHLICRSWLVSPESL